MGDIEGLRFGPKPNELIRCYTEWAGSDELGLLELLDNSKDQLCSRLYKWGRSEILRYPMTLSSVLTV